MGVAEFSTSLANFNQAQIDAIQAAVDAMQVAVDEIKNTDLADVDDKIGTSADGSALLTLFGKLAKIIGNTDGLSADTATLKTRMGTNVDASGTSTLFARLAQIVAYVDTLESALATVDANVDTIKTYTDGVEAKTNLIGTAADAAGTSTLFARLVQIAGYVDTLESTANTIKSNLDKIMTATPKMADFINSAASPQTWYTVLNYTGAGVLYKLYWFNDTQSYSWAAVRITVDGSAQTYDSAGLFDKRARTHQIDVGEGMSAIFNTHFETSLKVEIMNSVDPINGNAYIGGSVDYGIKG